MLVAPEVSDDPAEQDVVRSQHGARTKGVEHVVGDVDTGVVRVGPEANLERLL